MDLKNTRTPVLNRGTSEDFVSYHEKRLEQFGVEVLFDQFKDETMDLNTLLPE
jgi:hypothetical protein